MLKEQIDSRERAERIFKSRETQKADAQQATKDYYNQLDAIRARIQQLRKQRLARDAAALRRMRRAKPALVSLERSRQR